MFSGFRKKQAPFGEEEQSRFAESIGKMLKLQLITTGRDTLDNDAGQLCPKALGYCYGYVDAGLSLIGQNMADMEVGVPVMFHALRTAFPGREEAYMQFLIQNLKDPTVMLGIMLGGQQMIDYHNKKLAAPMGLAKCLLDAL